VWLRPKHRYLDRSLDLWTPPTKCQQRRGETKDQTSQWLFKNSTKNYRLYFAVCCLLFTYHFGINFSSRTRRSGQVIKMIDNLICKPKTLVGIYEILGFVWAVFYTQKYANPFGHNHHHRQNSATMGQIRCYECWQPTRGILFLFLRHRLVKIFRLSGSVHLTKNYYRLWW